MHERTGTRGKVKVLSMRSGRHGIASLYMGESSPKWSDRSPIASHVFESRPRSSNRVSSPRIAFQVLESRPRSSNRVSSPRIAFQVLESRPRSSNRVPVFKPNSLPFSATVVASYLI